MEIDGSSASSSLEIERVALHEPRQGPCPADLVPEDVRGVAAFGRQRRQQCEQGTEMTRVDGVVDGAFDERAGPSDLQADFNDAEGIGTGVGTADWPRA